MSSPKGPVAVLGAGIMGLATALNLARLGIRVTLFERESAPLRGASRWNEGKIHLGFLYAADPTLASARSVLAGGLAFGAEIERLTGVAPTERMTPGDDLYLIHRDSIVPPEAAGAYFRRVASLVREHPDAGRYLVDASGCEVEALGRAELEALADPRTILAGYRVPERSVDTNFVADALLAALQAEDRVEVRCDAKVEAVEAGKRGTWEVCAGEDGEAGFQSVVNATWEDRPRIDATVGHRPDRAPHHRYRVSVFARAPAPLNVPSAVVAAGRFGDVKNYGGRDLYVSWYPAGLLARAESVEAPPQPRLSAADGSRIADDAIARLGAVIPSVGEISRAGSEIRVEGGWVYSQGRGSLDDPGSGVHRRDRHRISRMRTYFSVDTGKYSVAPARARELARMIGDSL